MAKRQSSIDPIFDEEKKSGMRKYAVLGALVLIVGFIIYAAFANGGSPSGPVPIVQADNTAWTRAPEDVGGMDIPNQDSTVFELMRDEEPEDITIDEDLTKEEVAEDVQDDAPVEAVVETKKEDDPIGDLIEEKVVDPKVEPVADAKDDKPAQIPTLKAENSGNVMLRLGAVQSSDVEVARNEFVRLQKLSDGILDGRTPSFESVTLPEKGDFVRINITVDRNEADDICKALIVKNAPCLILK